MDNLLIKTKFMKQLISKIIARLIFKAYSIDVDVALEDLDVVGTNEHLQARLSIIFQVPKDELAKFASSHMKL